MAARDAEAAWFSRCVIVVRETTSPAHDHREANFFPHESDDLMQVSKRHFDKHPDEKIDPAQVGAGLTLADAIEERAWSAVAGYVGARAMLQMNLRDAVVIARTAKVRLSKTS